MKKSAFLYIHILIFLSLAGCGDEERAAAPSPAAPELKKETRAPAVDTGTLSFRIRWEGEPMTCAAGGVSAVEAKAYGPTGGRLASTGTMTCSSSAGLLGNVPAGPGVRLEVTGKDSSGAVLYRGERRGITIAAGGTTGIGTVTAKPFCPVLSAPAEGATLGSGPKAFVWSRVPGASAYRVQVSRDPDFASTLVDAVAAGASYKTSFELPSGEYLWRVRAADRSKDRGPWSSARGFTVDAEAPANTTSDNFIRGGSEVTYSAVVMLAISAEKENGVAAYHISENPKEPAADDKDWVQVTPAASYFTVLPYSLSPGDGEKAVYVRFKDATGNLSRTKSGVITLDTSPPHAMITSKPPGLTNSTSAAFGFTSAKRESTFECSLDGGPFSACSGAKTYEGLPPGPHTFKVKATDEAGNADPTPAGYAWTIDTTPPGAVITSRPPGLTKATAAVFGFTSAKSGATFECSLDNGVYSACTGMMTYEGLPDGPHAFKVRAIDAAGNVDPAPAGCAWTIDTTPPGAVITDRPADPSPSADAVFEFTSGEAGALFQCKLDTGPYSDCASGVAYTGLTEDTHSFSVKAADPLGNEDPVPAHYSWVVSLPPDNTTPPGFGNEARAPVIHKKEVTLAISATSTKGITGYYVSESPRPPDPHDAKWVETPAAETISRNVTYPLSGGSGTKTVHVWFRDAAGNVSEAKSYSVYFFKAAWVALFFILAQAVLIL